MLILSETKSLKQGKFKQAVCPTTQIANGGAVKSAPYLLLMKRWAKLLQNSLSKKNH
ncbi:MAG: hypothetical protein WCG95_05215 [bacterium]